MKKKTETRILFVGVGILLSIGVFNLFTLTDKADLAGTVMFMLIGLVALYGLYQDFKK